MLKHSLLLAFRSAKRYRSTFVINFVGLSTGLTCVLLIFLWVNDELAVDKFHEHDDRLYQIWQHIPRGDASIRTIEATPGPLAQALVDEFPEVEATTRSMSDWGGAKGILSADERHFKAKDQFVDANFFELFSFRLVVGDASQALSDKNAIVISKAMAVKLFQTPENSLGQTVEWNQANYRGAYSGVYTITGVFEDLPGSSSMQFDILFSIERFLENRAWLQSWGNSDPRTYVLLKEGANVAQLNAKISDYRRAKYQATEGNEHLDSIGTLFLQRYSDNYLFNRFENGVQTGGRIDYVRLFSLIALFLMAIASINFMNLSTAKASLRLKEIGIKKAVGVERKQLVFQFLTESILLSALSAIMAVFFVSILLPEFNRITSKSIELNIDIQFVFSFLAITLGVGLISGSYPALYLSRFKPIEILKGHFPLSMGGEWARKGLVVFQFVVSVILIIAVASVYKQIEWIHTKNLGYDKDNVITFKREGQLSENVGAFIEAAKQIPGVAAASSFAHDFMGRHGGLRGVSWGSTASDLQMHFSNLEVDYGLLELMGIEMVAGRSFSRDFGSESESIIFNKAAIAAMGIEEPIGHEIRLRDKMYQIIGVTEDFHFDSFYESIGPSMIQLFPNNRNVLIKVKAGAEEATLDRIEKLYATFNPGLPFEYRYLADDYQQLYAAENRIAVLSRYFAIIAIVISCLGLYGLASFKTERRRKEVSIRKVLGAGIFNLFRLLSGDFLRIVGLAILIAMPIGYYIVTAWLENFAYRIDVPWWYFAGTAAIALGIAWFTVGLQTLRAATVNPVVWLKED